MNIFPFKRRLRKKAVADLLYEDVFHPLVDRTSELLHERLFGEALLDNPSIKIRFQLECFSLMAFLVTFSFQREFEYLGQETNNFILDCFHSKLFENISGTFKDNTFPERLKTRYAEYYPTMKEDLRYLNLKIEDTILFRGVTGSFFNKVAPDKLKSVEILFFNLFLAELYSLICETYDKIKKYKIS